MLRLSVERVRQGHGYRNVFALCCGRLLFPSVFIRLRIEHNRMWKRFILLASKLATPWLRLLMLPPHNQVVSRLEDFFVSSQSSLLYMFSCYILSFLPVQNVISFRVTLLTSVEMTPLELMYCFALEMKPVHWMPGYQPLISVPTQLITDVDSMLPCLDFYPITGSFSVFTPCMECSFVQGLWRPNLLSMTDFFCWSVSAPYSMV